MVVPFPSSRSFTEAEKEATSLALEYWMEILKPEGAPFTPVVVRLGVNNDDFYNGSATYLESEETKRSLIYEALDGGVDVAVAPSEIPGDVLVGSHARIQISNFAFDTQSDSQLPETLTTLTPTIIHEMGHAIGIHESNPDYAIHLEQMTPSGGGDDIWVFKGENASKVFGAPIPMAQASEEVASHFAVRNGLMTHYQIVNYPMFMEAELAAIEDIGYTLDRRSFFGLSLYATEDRTSTGTTTFTLEGEGGYEAFYENQGDGVISRTIVNKVGFFQSLGLGASGDWLGYDENMPNTKPYAVGLHIYGDGYTVTEEADILAYGQGAAGIRIDGFKNAVVIPEGVTVAANGRQGTGLLAAFGAGHVITSMGTIEATGDRGIAARFDMGAPYVSELVVLSSYGEYMDPYNEGVEIGGPLVEEFNLSGSLLGGPSGIGGQWLSGEHLDFGGRPIALYIGPNAHVKAINIMNGSEIQGDMISRWDPAAHSRDPEDYSTSLTFGLLMDQDGKATGNPDPHLSLSYSGNIIGPESLNVSLEGGVLEHSGKVDALSFRMAADTTLISGFGQRGPSTISADSIDLDPDSAVAFDPDPFSYGAVLQPGENPLVTFIARDGEVVGTPQLDQSSGSFSMGAYDYTWDGLSFSGGSVNLDSVTRTLGDGRAGTDQQNAPLFMLMASTWHDAAFQRLERSSLARRLDSYASGKSEAASAGSMDPGAGGPNGPDDPEGSDSAGPSGSDDAWAAGEDGAAGGTVWISPSFHSSRHKGARSFRIRGSSVSAGADCQITGSFLLGLALSLDFPRYSSIDSHVEGRGASVILYSGIDLPGGLDLDLAASMGSMRFTGSRAVEGERHESDFQSDARGVGASLGRAFQAGGDILLRPFASYDYMHVDRGAYGERAGTYSLSYDGASNGVHRLRAGSGARLDLDSAWIGARAWWQGLRGQTREGASAFFTQDPGRNRFSAPVEALDRDSLGLEAGFGIRLGDRLEASASYSFLGGRRASSHEASAALKLGF
jgi:hypothetical protein